MKTIAKFFPLLILISSCSKLIEPTSEPNFIFNNNENIEIKDFKIYIEDVNLNTLKSNGSPVLVFENLKMINVSEPTPLKIKENSKTGEGTIKLIVTLSNDKELNIGLGNFKDYKIYTEFVPKNWQTLIIYLEGGASSPILKSEIGKYEDGKLVKNGI
ncbi:MAG: hypothetical protein IPH28_04700 [Cytophagaceae bacterium]|nr:hypothetical protein [Cytophagaceae bacterium]MBK9935731.1 hypothetical protein [Cytophagaceae bacterium]MBL0304233.1 hypothetical protein [Cytophagaceae bacterium]MBL0324992.1 hypothetical protein [Cytophagaceae bacterium]